MPVTEGSTAPDFTLSSDSGETVSLSALKGKPVVLYFYPKDDTPGCTKQACGIRDAWGEFERSGAVVLGVSPDNEASHVKFKEKYEPPVHVARRPGPRDRGGVRRLGREVEYGKTYMGVERSTFVVDADGKVATVMRKVKPETHADDVLPALGLVGALSRPEHVEGRPRRAPFHMRMRGLEPPRPERHTDLNRARLPIPPHPRDRGV